MEISANTVKELRQKTGAGVMDCKKALTEAGGNFDKACAIITERGLAIAKKKSERSAEQGLIECYVHTGNHLGVMVELNCETDFVARTPEFKELAHNIALQISAMAPQYVSKDDLPAGAEEDPAAICLLLQPFIKDPAKSIQDIITETVAKTGENIKVRRFVRFELGY
ncbi:MAG: translation elongation factor Ts [Dehalococcoidia bacterium]|nr:translation elongation factor Ts [Dehalococcoidia bacterium]